MVAYKASQILSFLKAPDARIRAALLYGPDPAQVADHAATLARRAAEASEPPGEIIRIDDRDLAERPDLLAIEAQTLSMFAASKVIRVVAGARFPVDDVEAMLAEPMETWLIVEAGSLRPNAKLRKIFEASSHAAALPCYELGTGDMARFIDGELESFGVTIEADARQHLVALFSGNQARARAEIEKLALYAGPGGRIALADVDAAVGDVAQAGLDTLCLTAGNRDAKGALHQLDRLLATGQNAQGAILALGRHFERLHRLCAAVEAGNPVNSVLAGFRPPLHFRVRDALQAQVRSWSRAGAERALRLVAQAARSARLRPDLDAQLAERLVIAVSGQK
jgi:DNA polymerase-3 subunit delta